MPSGATNNRIDKRKVASAVTNMKKKKIWQQKVTQINTNKYDKH